MTIGRARTTLALVFYQRCFYLFVAMLALIMAMLLLEPTPRGRIMLNGGNLLVVIAAVAAIGRTQLSFVIALLLAMPTLVFQLLAIDGSDSRFLLHSWMFGAALYAATIGYLLRYVFQHDVMTADKLYGAAAAYLMLGALWAYLYAMANHIQPGSFAFGGAVISPPIGDLLYFSFTVLTSTGFGDAVPVQRYARGLCVLEQLVGGLFLAILIARLAGVYPPRREDSGT
ncbi:ion channel [Variovorax saccharolyticus]|uniref:ion channel n=1 Tax=Variovorax saccharolyticus TaxID=3053516 RepID=UPI002577F3BF|nr:MULTISPECIES: ion channel [unclassified Variovorax]MDM0022895.1 ion channel [Variovorax sp. J22R187]MDM0030303.1 ion channel [Variovorax sp. J31P216]